MSTHSVADRRPLRTTRLVARARRVRRRMDAGLLRLDTGREYRHGQAFVTPYGGGVLNAVVRVKLQPAYLRGIAEMARLRGASTVVVGIQPDVAYAMVELGTGVLFAVAAWHLGLSWELPAFLYLAAISVALAMIDIDVHRQNRHRRSPLPNLVQRRPQYPV